MTDFNSPAVIKGRKGFLPGRSGNPAGRPKGAKNTITLQKVALEGELRQQLKAGGNAQAILQKAIDMALAGDGPMIKLLIDKMIPTSKSADDAGEGKEKVQIIINKLSDREDGRVTIEGQRIKDVN